MQMILSFSFHALLLTVLTVLLILNKLYLISVCVAEWVRPRAVSLHCTTS
jgi:hypothetical protein